MYDALSTPSRLPSTKEERERMQREALLTPAGERALHNQLLLNRKKLSFSPSIIIPSRLNFNQAPPSPSTFSPVKTTPTVIFNSVRLRKRIAQHPRSTLGLGSPQRVPLTPAPTFRLGPSKRVPVKGSSRFEQSPMKERRPLGSESMFEGERARRVKAPLIKWGSPEYREFPQFLSLTPDLKTFVANEGLYYVAKFKWALPGDSRSFNDKCPIRPKDRTADNLTFVKTYAIGELKKLLFEASNYALTRAGLSKSTLDDFISQSYRGSEPKSIDANVDALTTCDTTVANASTSKTIELDVSKLRWEESKSILFSIKVTCC